MEELRGRVDAVAGNKSGIKISGKWYDVEQSVQKFLPSKGTEIIATLKDNKISFIKVAEQKAKEIAEPQIEKSAVITEEDIKNTLQADLTWAIITAYKSLADAEKELQKQANFTSEDIQKITTVLFLELQRKKLRSLRGDEHGDWANI